MQKIYKRGILENRLATSSIMAATLATTFSLALVMIGAPNYWPFAALAAIPAGIAYGRLGRPYEMTASARRIAALLSVNAFILIVYVLVS